MKTNPNENAFPSAGTQNFDESNIIGGLTKLEYFCASALQGLSLNASYFDHSMHRVMANAAICIAKALIDELNKEVESNE